MLNNSKKIPFFGQILLLLATLIWGTSFFILKGTLNVLPVFFVLAIRFSLSALLIFIVFYKRILKTSLKTLIYGLILGVILASAYILQTNGLKGVTPGENAFLTSVYTVIVPFLFWAIAKKKPDIFSIIAAFTCVLGVGFVAFYNGSNFIVGWGHVLTLFCTVFYALQIIVISFCAEKTDPVGILFFELLTVGVVCLIGTFSFEVGRVDIKLDGMQVLKLAYLSVFCTLLAQGLQILGQKTVPASQSSIILSLESVFGLIFSLILGGEDLTPITVLGFILIFVSVIISETKLKFITKLFKKNNPVDIKENK